MVVSAMTVVGGTKLLVWTAALLLTNLLTAVIFTVTNQPYYSGTFQKCRIMIFKGGKYIKVYPQYVLLALRIFRGEPTPEALLPLSYTCVFHFDCIVGSGDVIGGDRVPKLHY